MIESPTRARLEFQADTARVLHLMVHSMYTQKEIFLRELISNASDALNRLRFEGLTHSDWLTSAPLEIRLEVDRRARTLTVRDNGIGMREDDVREYLGTIARSMSHAVSDDPGQGAVSRPASIGQFGVGFYSSFMVADRVALVTRHPSEPDGVIWECAADSDHYTMEPAPHAERGTAVTLFLKAPDEDGGLEDYSDRWVLTRLVKRHSDFIAYPITVRELEPPAPLPGEPEETMPPIDAPLNSMKPIWTRPAADVSDNEYDEFYKHVAHDWKSPSLRFSFRAEGRYEYHALLFVPAEASPDLYYHAAPGGLQLYAQRVLVMEHCDDLLPRYLRFLKGIVDSADLPLHISRQMLQEQQQIARIRKWLTRKVLDAFADLQERDRARYLALWTQFGRAIKEGVGTDYDNRERLIPMLLFESSHDAASLTTLAEYVKRMKEDQREIYHLTGASRAVIEHSPHLEAVREKGYEVLYLVDPVDELVVQSVTELGGKPLRSVLKGKLALGGEEEQRAREQDLEEATTRFAPLLEAFRGILHANVRAVRLSPRLVDAPVCLAGEHADDSPRVEQLLLRGKGGGPRQRRVLELNPRHPIVRNLLAHAAPGTPTPLIEQCAHLLYGQALLAEGSELTDHVGFTRVLTGLMTDRLAANGAPGDEPGSPGAS